MGAKNTYKLLNETLAQNEFLKALRTISGLLSFVGKPFFLLFSYIFLTVVTILYITGRILHKIIKATTTLSSPLFFLSKKLFKTRRTWVLLPWKKIRKKGVIFADKTKNVSVIFLSNFFNVTKTLFFSVFTLVSGLFKWYFRLVKFTTEKFSLFVLKIKLSVLTSNRDSLKILASLFASCFILIGSAAVIFWFVIMRDLPKPSALAQRTVPMSTKIYDRNGTLLYTIYKDQNRTPVKLSEIPVNVRLATIAIEDAEFYSHPGFSIRGIMRALIKDVKEGNLTGGSTITQQLVKNTLLTPEKTLTRKLKEIVLAVQVELKYDKNEILEMYLNEVPYGGTTYGIKEAARTYFDKDVRDLTLAEATLLAGLPKSPSRYSPATSDSVVTIARQKDVLNLMRINGFITEAQQKEAENDKLTFAEIKTEIQAPHFVFYVKELLEEEFGRGVVESGGLEVITTLDLNIQNLAEKVVAEEIEKLKSLNVSNGAVIVLDPKTGEILAMVGSKNYFDNTADGNVNVTIRPRQPGSSIKVVNYAYALSNGLTAATIINDSPITFDVEGQPPYSPKNYEGGFRGNLTLRNAFAESRNIPAVKVLASYGVKNMIDMGQKMGITTWTDPQNYGLSLTLGGGEVTLLELAKVYSTIANYGKRPDIEPILKVTDYKGKVLKEFACKDSSNPIFAESTATSSAKQQKGLIYKDCPGEKVLDPRVAFIITDILKDNSARTPSFGPNSLLVIPKHKEVAVKTGTSNNLRDNLTVGYTQDYVVAVWIGNNDNSVMNRVASGVTGATPIWNKIMSALLAQKSVYDWPIPEKLIQLPICPYTGTFACEGCPIKMEWFLEENKPEKACNPEWFKEKENGQDQNENLKIIQDQTIYSNSQQLDNLLKEQFKRKKKPQRNN